VISGVDASYQESVNRLSKALGHIQFQDVMRQRLEHVQEALREMCAIWSTWLKNQRTQTGMGGWIRPSKRFWTPSWTLQDGSQAMIILQSLEEMRKGSQPSRY